MALPGYLEDTGKHLATQMTATYGTPIQTGAFTPQVAPQDPMQTQAIGMATAGLQSYAPYLTAAQTAMGQAGTAADWKEYNKLETDRKTNDLNYNSIMQRKKEFHDNRLLSEIIQLAVKPTNLSSTNIHDHHEISVAKKHLAENREKGSNFKSIENTISDVPSGQIDSLKKNFSENPP